MPPKTKVTQAPDPKPTPVAYPTRRSSFSILTLVERLIYIVFGVLQVILAFRFILSLLAANKNNVFADFIFATSQPFVGPFLNLFNYQTAYGASRLELETLIAMAVYALISGFIVALCRLPRRTGEV